MISGTIENLEYIRKEDSSTTLTSTKNYSSKKANTLYYIVGAYILTKPLTNYDYVTVLEYIFYEKEDKWCFLCFACNPCFKLDTSSLIFNLQIYCALFYSETIVQSDRNHFTRA